MYMKGRSQDQFKAAWLTAISGEVNTLGPVYFNTYLHEPKGFKKGTALPKAVRRKP